MPWRLSLNDHWNPTLFYESSTVKEELQVGQKQEMRKCLTRTTMYG